MKEQLKKTLRDELTKKVLNFFYQNQASIDSARGIATWVNSDRGVVKKVLDDLVRIGVLEKDSTGITKGYCYTRNKNTMKIVEGLMRDV